VVELCVDIGNTNLKWAVWEDGAMGASHTLGHQSEDGEGLAQAWISLPRPRRIRVANVSGEKAQHMLVATSRRLWGLEPRFARPRQGVCGTTIAYAEPQRLGVDRWLAMIALHHGADTPAVVLDCGTAITLDAIDGNGQHLGGLILPGLRMMWQGLMAGTRIPMVSFAEHAEMLGTDTGECIAGGAQQAVAGMTERVWRYLNRTHGITPQVILTGSDAETIGEQLELPSQYRPDLVLQGLTCLKY